MAVVDAGVNQTMLDLSHSAQSLSGTLPLPPVLMLPLLALLSVMPQQQPALMPLPAAIRYAEGRLRLDSTLSTGTDGFRNERLERALARVLGRLEQRIAQPLSRQAGAGAGRLRLEVAGAGEEVQSLEEDESYTLAISPSGARLTAPTVVGALRGLATLEQLVASDSAGFYLPAVSITDAPRFRWRGLLVDAGRHFMPPEVIRRTLDGMALVKLNVLHWHLSDDQGFRVESRRFPRLHQLGSDGQYYSQEDIRGIVAYARDRGIRVVPEFDMPGHATSWFVGYPEFASAIGPYAIERHFGVFEPAFDPTREETYQFIEGFITEMADLFPDQYWHIGGDEVVGRHWNSNPRILRFKREHGFTDNEALQGYFNQRLARILGKLHRRMVGWDEVLHPGLPEGTLVQSWRGTEYLGRAARQGLSGILSAPYYLDHIKPADEHYLADPLPEGHNLSPAEAGRVLGGEACMWAEHVNPETVDSRLWPRLAAVAERFWSPQSVRNVPDMYRRLSLVSIHLERAGLGHEAHSYRMLRLLSGQRGVEPLHDLLAYTMPVSFGQRSRQQRTTQLTPLTRLVDAARPDPWSRSGMMRLAERVAAGPRAAETEMAELGRIFAGWRELPARVGDLTTTVPLASDGVAAAAALARLATLGQEALGYLSRDGAPAVWKTATRAELETLAGPQDLLRITGVEAVRILVDAT